MLWSMLLLLLFFGDLTDLSLDFLGLQSLIQDILLDPEQLLLPFRLSLPMTRELKLQGLDLSLQLLLFTLSLVDLSEDVSYFGLVLCQSISAFQCPLHCLSDPFRDLPLQKLQKLAFLFLHQRIPPLLHFFKLPILPYIFLLKPLPPPQSLHHPPLHLTIPLDKHRPKPTLDRDYPIHHQAVILHVLLFLIMGVLPLVLFLNLQAEGGHEVCAFGTSQCIHF